MNRARRRRQRRRHRGRPASADADGDRRCCAQRALLDDLHRAEQPIERVRAVVLHTDGAGVHASSATRAIVYDCMDELSRIRERARRAASARGGAAARAPTLVFTGGQSALRSQARISTANVHRVPEQRRRRAFRAGARHRARDPADQAPIPHPRLGFFGVIDERMDLDAARRRRRRAARLASRDARAGRQDRSRARCRGAEHPLPRVEDLPASCRTTSPAGTSRCCRSRATRRRGSSARPRRPSTWPPASRWSRRRSATWCARTASRGSSRIADTVEEFVAAVRGGAGRRCRDARCASARRVPAPDVVGRHLDADARPGRRQSLERLDAQPRRRRAAAGAR